MLSTKRPGSPESGPGPTSKKMRTSRRVAVPNHTRKVRAATLHVSSSGRIGRKKVKVEKEVLPPSNSPIDAEPNGLDDLFDNPDPLSLEGELDTGIFDGQEMPSISNDEKNSAENKKKRSTTNSVKFLLSFFILLFLKLFTD